MGEKCLFCGADLQGTGKDYDSFWDTTDDKKELMRLLNRVPETVREQYVYNNPLFDKEKYEAREQEDHERIERNKAGLIFRFVEERVVVDVFFPDSFFKAF